MNFIYLNFYFYLVCNFHIFSFSCSVYLVFCSYGKGVFCSYGKGDFRCGTALVFLPGLPEILEVKDALGNSPR